MGEVSLADRYEEMLVDVGARASEFGDRPIASHWPFVGSHFSGTIIVGQALAGWDAEDCSARWLADEATTDAGRAAIVKGTRAWAESRPEPMDEVMRWSHRWGSPFWGLSQRLMRILEPDATPWHSRHAWWNVYPLGWDRPGSSPGPKLRAAQAGHVGGLFWEVVSMLQARRIVIVAGADWWPDVRARLGLEHLERRSTPILAAGRARDVTVVATYHPGAHIKGLTRDDFAAQIGAEIRALEGPGCDENDLHQQVETLGREVYGDGFATFPATHAQGGPEVMSSNRDAAAHGPRR
jgi:hypothetical protein